MMKGVMSGVMRSALLVLTLGLLSACAGNMGRGIPAPVETRGEVVRTPAPVTVEPPPMTRPIEPIVESPVRPVEIIPPAGQGISDPERPSAPASPVSTPFTRMLLRDSVRRPRASWVEELRLAAKRLAFPANSVRKARRK